MREAITMRQASRPGGWTRREWLQGMAGAGVALATGSSRPLLALARDLPPPPQIDSGIAGLGSLEAHAVPHGLLVGCAVNTGLLRTDPGYGRLISEQFNIVVGENCMKWETLRPSPTTYDFAASDALVGFAQQEGLKVRGHNLCWHEGLPAWFAGTVNAGNARQVLTEHIHAVVGRYKGHIHSWDVVNEAISPKDGRPDGLRNSPWLELLGPDYLEIAFRAAREADPAVLLTYNDYGIEYDEIDDQAKRVQVLALLNRLHAAGTPIDAVGIQSHLRTDNIGRLGDGLRDFTRHARKLKLEVYLTELDVNDDGLPAEDTNQQDRDVAAVYHHYLETMLKEQSIKAVLTWGVADQQSWLQNEKWRIKSPERKPRPLPFSLDENNAYLPKPAFYAMRDSFDKARRR